MLGLNGIQLFQKIDSGAFGGGYLAANININNQKALQPNDILQKLATGVAKAIEANNQAIERQLRNAGIEL
jgi:hypothetical protein